MSWRTISAEEVFSKEEREQSTVLANAGATIEAELQNVVGAARGAIKVAGTPLGAAGTIPDQVRQDVVSIAAWRALMKLPMADALMTKQRQEAYESGMKRLDKVAAGEVRVEMPDGQSQSGGAWGACDKQNLSRM